MTPATPASKYPGAQIEDETESRKPAQATTESGPGAVSTKYVDNRPQGVKDAEEEGIWEKVEDKEVEVPLNSPDEPYTLVLRKPIMTSRKEGTIKQLVLKPPRYEAFEKIGDYNVVHSQSFRNTRTKEERVDSWIETNYGKLLRHIEASAGVPVEELRAMNASDVNRAGGILTSMSNAMPFR